MPIDPETLQALPTSQLRWWALPASNPREVGQAVLEAARWVNTQQLARQASLTLCARLYGKLDPDVYGSPMAGLLAWPEERDDAEPPKLSANVVRAVVDTATAKITGLDVRPSYLTSGGDWAQQQRAKKLEKFSDGQLHAAGMKTLGPEAFRDACIFDVGLVKVFARGDEPCVERVFPLEFLVDRTDARYGRPRQAFQLKWVAIEELLEDYPEAAADILASGAALGGWGSMINLQTVSQQLVNHVMVVEAWLLPNGKTKGRHVISCGSTALLDEEWTRPRFPFAVVRYSKNVRGWYGVGMAHHLKDNQREINQTLQTIQEVIQLGAVPTVWLQAGNKVPRGSLTNELMAVRTYVGQKPEFFPGIGPHESLLQHVDNLWNRSFQQEGVSPLDAQSQKPAGLDSGAAIRTYRDVGTERFSVATKHYEQFVLDVSELLVECGREIHQKSKRYMVLVPGRRFAEKLDFGDVDLERDKYVLQLFPTNMLPATPEGRLNMLQDLMKAGLVDAVQGKRLLGFPDIEAEMSLELAPVEDILAEISHLLEGGAYRPPEPFQSLGLGVKFFQWSYLRARRDGAPEDILANLQLWMEQAQDLLDMQSQGAQGAGQVGPPQPDTGMGTPQGKPAPAPTSNLLPTAPGGAPMQGAPA